MSRMLMRSNKIVLIILTGRMLVSWLIVTRVVKKLKPKISVLQIHLVEAEISDTKSVVS